MRARAPHADMTIRQATPGEAAALSGLCLRSKAHWGYDAGFLAACRLALMVCPMALQDGRVWAAVRGPDGAGNRDRLRDSAMRQAQRDDLLGCAQTDVVPDAASAESGPAWVVDLFFVAPHAMGQGVGRALWQHVEHEARLRGVCSLELQSDPGAVGFYEAMGCRTLRSVPSGLAPGRMLPVLGKRIEGNGPEPRNPGSGGVDDQG